MTAPQSTPLPPAPQRNESESEFIAKSNAFVAALPPFQIDLQAQADFVNDKSIEVESNAELAAASEEMALAAGNYAGVWSSLTGAGVKGISVAHNGSYWGLLANIADIPSNEPGVSGFWQIITKQLGTAASKDTGTAAGQIPLNSDLGSGSKVDTGTDFDQIPLNADIVYPVDSVQSIAGLIGTQDDQQISLKGWHPDSDVGGGTLYWDAAKLKSEHNGGTVFSPTVPYSVIIGDYLDGVGETNAAGSGCWVRRDNSSVKISEFGAMVWPFVSTDSIQAAINYAITTNTMAAGSNGSGKPKILVDTGLFETGNLSMTSAIGIKIVGSGQQSSTIVFTGESGTLLNISTYIGVYLEDITIAAGTVSAGVGGAVITKQVTPNNTAIKFNGTNGGTNYIERNVKYIGWHTVYDTTTSVVNEDGHTYNNCRYLNNTAIWNNTNTQAVIWAFKECQIFYNTGNVFNNPGSKLAVYGGDYINPGTFLKGSAANTTTDILLKGLRFENYQNLNPSSNPVFLDLSGTHRIQLEQCSSIGGGSLTGKDSFLLNGNFDLMFDECSFGGNIAATVASSLSGVTSKLTFERCREIPIIVQTTTPGQANTPLNVIYKDMPIGGGLVNRRFAGELPSQTRPITAPTNSDQIKFQGVLNAVTGIKSIPILILDNYSFIISRVKIVWRNNTPETVNIKVWNDSTKTTQIADITTGSLSGSHQIFEISGADLMNIPVLTGASDDVYVEIIAATNAGTCTAMIEIETSQTS